MNSENKVKTLKDQQGLSRYMHCVLAAALFPASRFVFLCCHICANHSPNIQYSNLNSSFQIQLYCCFRYSNLNISVVPRQGRECQNGATCCASTRYEWGESLREKGGSESLRGAAAAALGVLHLQENWAWSAWNWGIVQRQRAARVMSGGRVVLGVVHCWWRVVCVI